MAKKDMIGQITRASVGLEFEDQGLVLDIINKLNGVTSAEVHKNLAAALQTSTASLSTNLTINLDADPVCPNGWTVEEHKPGGQFTWNQAKVELHYSPNQKGEKFIQGQKLREELAPMPVFNANVLDWLLANPHAIPEACKGKATFFWGTIYRDSGGCLCVRYLFWRGDRWGWSFFLLDLDWARINPALVPAST